MTELNSNVVPHSSSSNHRDSIVDQVRRKKGAWTVEELAGFLDLSPKLLYKLIKTHKMNAYRIGTLLRIDGQDAADYLATHATIPRKLQPPKPR